MADAQQDNQTQDKEQPTEDQVKSANELEKAKWEGDFKEEDLTVPYKREAEDDKTGPDKNKGGGDDGSSDLSESDDIESQTEEATYSEPAPVVTVTDPGEYKPADYSFEVTLKDGKTHKVGSPEEAEKLADDPDNFETPKQLMDFINKSQRMSAKLDRDHDKWTDQKQLFDSQTETETERMETVNNMAAEFEYLISKGLLPPVADEYKSVDWQNPEVRKQPGVKEQTQLLDYMIKENAAREKAGVRPLNSVIDAFNAWTLENGKSSAQESEKKAGEARKAAGARVAGVSPSQQVPYVPKGIAVGRTGIFDRNQAVWDN